LIVYTDNHDSLKYFLVNYIQRHIKYRTGLKDNSPPVARPTTDDIVNTRRFAIRYRIPKLRFTWCWHRSWNHFILVVYQINKDKCSRVLRVPSGTYF